MLFISLQLCVIGISDIYYWNEDLHLRRQPCPLCLCVCVIRLAFSWPINVHICSQGSTSVSHIFPSHCWARATGNQTEKDQTRVRERKSAAQLSLNSSAPSFHSWSMSQSVYSALGHYQSKKFKCPHVDLNQFTKMFQLYLFWVHSAIY